MKKILVCGGRDYGTWITEEGHKAVNHYEVEKLNNTLDAIKQEFETIIIIQGEARGADSLAKSWAIRNKVATLNFPADWASYGKSAGYLRNVQMLEEGTPDLVIAFPGGSGTAMMCKIAKSAGVEVRQIS
jgi:hypothetical protein